MYVRNAKQGSSLCHKCTKTKRETRKKGRTDIWQAGNGALGLETSLLVMLTIVRGTVVAENGEVVGQPGHGKMVRPIK